MRKRKRIQYLDCVEQLKPAALLKDEKLVQDREKNKLTAHAESQCSREHNNKTSKMFYDAHTDGYEGY